MYYLVKRIQSTVGEFKLFCNPSSGEFGEIEYKVEIEISGNKVFEIRLDSDNYLLEFYSYVMYYHYSHLNILCSLNPDSLNGSNRVIDTKKIFHIHDGKFYLPQHDNIFKYYHENKVNICNIEKFPKSRFIDISLKDNSIELTVDAIHSYFDEQLSLLHRLVNNLLSHN